MDVSSITGRIEDSARQNAKRFLDEANSRIQSMQDACDGYVEQSRREAVRDAEAEAKVLEQNLRRLGALEDRKDLLRLKHELIDEGFEAARAALLELPEKELKQLFLRLVRQAAQGHELVSVGAIKPGFYQGFVAEANALLQKDGKPGGLKDANKQRAGICGVILSSPGSEVHCTLDMLLRGKREALEGEVARILCSQLD